MGLTYKKGFPDMSKTKKLYDKTIYKLIISVYCMCTFLCFSFSILKLFNLYYNFKEKVYLRWL